MPEIDSLANVAFRLNFSVQNLGLTCPQYNIPCHYLECAKNCITCDKSLGGGCDTQGDCNQFFTAFDQRLNHGKGGCAGTWC